MVSVPAACRGSRYDDNFVLNMSSAAKIERIVDKVRSLSEYRFDPKDMPQDWFRRILDTGNDDDEGSEDPISGEDSRGSGVGRGASTRGPRDDLPMFHFKTLLITGTAGAGKTSSIQTLAANLNCVISGTTVIASQNLSSVLNRTRAAQIKTIFRIFGFNSKHVSMSDSCSGNDRASSGANSAPLTIEAQQKYDLGTYWPVISDLVSTWLDIIDKGGRKKDISELCDSNIIVIDECGVLLRHMLHVVVFFYYFYNAIHDTVLYRERRIPCIVCVGSPTQSEALETRYLDSGLGKNVRRGLDVLSALISDSVLGEYCDVFNNWVMFINNKRCTNLDFSDLLKHIEFGLPLTQAHIEYVDCFVRPTGLIRDPSYALNATRLFISHAEVQKYFKRLHDRLRLYDRDSLFDLPVYCVINNRNYEEYCELCDTPNLAGTPDVWFKNNLSRIMNYSQFVDQNLSDDVRSERLGGDDDEESAETLITMKITYIRDSSIGVNARVKSCVIGFSGTFNDFVDILQHDTFIDKTPCEQAIYAYSLISGLLYSAMYLFYSSSATTEEALMELSSVDLPDIPVLSQSGAVFGSRDDGFPTRASAREPAWTVEEVPVTSEYVGLEVSDSDMISCTELYLDTFFVKYAKPPSVSCMSFEDIVHVYTVFRDIFIKRYQILQRHSNGTFGQSPMVTYNRRNVTRNRTCEIVSHTGTFVGMLSYASPASGYVLEGYTNNAILTMSMENRIHPTILERGLPRLVVRDPLGFINVLEPNVSKFVDSSHGKSLNICTTVDYGINSRTAMTITKSQGLSLERVAIDFGDDPKNLRLSQIYVAMSRVVNPDRLIMNLNPIRTPYERNTYITPFICRALKNENTILIF